MYFRSYPNVFGVSSLFSGVNLPIVCNMMSTCFFGQIKGTMKFLGIK